MFLFLVARLDDLFPSAHALPMSMLSFSWSRIAVKRGAAVVVSRNGAWLRPQKQKKICLHHRTLVWHAGYLQEQESKELANAIQALQTQLEKSKFHQCMGTQEQLKEVHQQEKQLADLYQEYETLTGESYQHRQEETTTATLKMDPDGN